MPLRVWFNFRKKTLELTNCYFPLFPFTASCTLKHLIMRLMGNFSLRERQREDANVAQGE